MKNPLRSMVHIACRMLDAQSLTLPWHRPGTSYYAQLLSASEKYRRDYPNKHILIDTQTLEVVAVSLDARAGGLAAAADQLKFRTTLLTVGPSITSRLLL